MDQALENLRDDISLEQKKGLPFMITSIVIWTMIFLVTRLSWPENAVNTAVFCCSCPLMPLSWQIGKWMGVDIFSKKNPLGKVGFLFTCNQMLYLLIVMWVFNEVPEKMVMVYAMVFGAHLLPYSWLYKSRVYAFFALFIPVVSLILGTRFPGNIVAFAMIPTQSAMVILLSKTFLFRR